MTCLGVSGRICFGAHELLIGLWMKRARHQLSPLMPFEKSIDRCLIHFMSYFLLKCLLDLCSSSKFSLFCQLEKWCQQFLFFLKCQIFISSSAFSRCFYCCNSQPIVCGN